MDGAAEADPKLVHENLRSLRTELRGEIMPPAWRARPVSGAPALLVAACLAAAPGRAAASDPVMVFPDTDHFRVAFGPSIAWAYDSARTNAAALGVDLAFVYSLFWVSPGFRALVPGDPDATALAPYVEVGLWYFANMGVGYDHAVRLDGGGSDGFHLFAGFPLTFGDDLPVEETGFFWEPYVRVAFLWGDAFAVVPEAGILVKLSVFVPS